MYKVKSWLLTVLGLSLATLLSAHINPERASANRGDQEDNPQVSFRESCDNARSQIDQAINNVRARLTTGGDVWWDGNDGRYVVPKVPPGVPEVSSLFAGAVWLGGLDPSGNLKLAAQTYGRATGDFDFWPGPLTPEPENPGDPPRGITEQETCKEWDRFFTVTGEEIDEHLRKFELAQETGVPYDPADIPEGVRGWPARGNEFFFDIHNFELPNTSQGLAGFWDINGDDIYQPQLGEYPVIEIRGCEEDPQYPDEMIFWIYNDAGNIHAETSGDKIQMEVQVQAFSYASNDELNDMTFQRYKLINRAVDDIRDCYFAMWTDPDLGCYTDDYIGCDTLRSLAYVYNSDPVDGESGCSCPGGVNTYCENIPLLGVDYFRGPIRRIFDENNNVVDSVELGMTSFTYYNNGGVAPTPPQGTTDPANAQQYYNYLRGLWLDGQPFEYGGDGRNEGTEAIRFAFTEAPDESAGWSMCTQNLPYGDRRTVQASGPLLLQPGAVNELIIGVVWVADQDYPCPDIRRLQEADDIAQALFDNCFDVTDGPDAPDVDWIELDRELIAVFTNDPSSNNFNEGYAEEGLQIPPLEEDRFYVFEGYKLFQLAGADVTVADLNNPDKARLVYQVDIENEIATIFNWTAADESPLSEPVYVPTPMVEGLNQGIRHTFNIREDQFATGQDRRLINHKKYYFVALAYAHNEYEPFDPRDVTGQRLPYLEGRSNIGDGVNPFYTVIPRPIVDRRLNAKFGDGAVITRVDGVGTGDNFLDINDETRAAIEAGFKGGNDFNGEITYQPGRGPINIKIFNPLDVVDGDFELRFVDSDGTDNVLDAGAHWELRNLTDPSAAVIASESTIEKLNEQIIPEFGFSIAIGQVPEPGTPAAGDDNGFIGFEAFYSDLDKPFWLLGIPDGFRPGGNFLDAEIFNYVKTEPGFPDAALDPEQAYTTQGPGWFVPYILLDYEELESPILSYVTPAWYNNFNGIVRSSMDFEDLNNVDVVLTSNKDLWSRCVVVETASEYYEVNGFLAEGDAGMFDLRQAPSVLKEADPATGLPVQGTIDNDEPDNGMGWFPGYAIDVETGQRLNVFFGENSVYDCQNLTDRGLGIFCQYFADSTGTGGDMMFNPGDQVKINEDADPNIFQYYAGGQHFVYVTKQPYDGCKLFQDRLTGFPTRKVLAMRDITWAGFIQRTPGEELLSYADGLIPNDATLKMRVNNAYKVELDANNTPDIDTRTGTGVNNYHPAYRFSIEGKQAAELTEPEVENALDMINVVPNPYYGFSDYEVSQFTNTIKITNLPPKCVVTIYTLDGKFIRQYLRDEVGAVPEGNNRAIERAQVIPDLEWDLKNNKGIPIASGVYLIHVSAEGLGERTLKWFGVNRKFDPSGL